MHYKLQNKIYEQLIQEKTITSPVFGTPVHDKIIKESHVMQRLILDCINSAYSDAPVLITGETGVGKEVIASLIHSSSPISTQPFVKVNCAAIPPELFESEFFGYEEGSFTGAKRGGKPGLFELANNGTIFLDEIGDFPLMLQSKLLRILQEYEIRRIGGTQPIKLSFRLISATNQDLSDLISKGKFRSDLFYRINVINIKIPPLRERIEDIQPLVELKLQELCEKYKINKSFTPEAIQLMKNYKWPGNVRELENIVARLFFSTRNNTISLNDIIDNVDLISNSGSTYAKMKPNMSIESAEIREDSLKEAIKQFEITYIEDIVCRTKSLKEAAVILGIDASTLTRKCQRYNIRKK